MACNLNKYVLIDVYLVYCSPSLAKSAYYMRLKPGGFSLFFCHRAQIAPVVFGRISGAPIRAEHAQVKLTGFDCRHRGRFTGPAPDRKPVQRSEKPPGPPPRELISMSGHAVCRLAGQAGCGLAAFAARAEKTAKRDPRTTRGSEVSTGGQVHFAGVEDVVGVQGALQQRHGGHGGFIMFQGHERGLDQTDAVFTG